MAHVALCGGHAVHGQYQHAHHEDSVSLPDLRRPTLFGVFCFVVVDFLDVPLANRRLCFCMIQGLSLRAPT